MFRDFIEAFSTEPLYQLMKSSAEAKATAEEYRAFNLDVPPFLTRQIQALADSVRELLQRGQTGRVAPVPDASLESQQDAMDGLAAAVLSDTLPQVSQPIGTTARTKKAIAKNLRIPPK